MGRFTRVGKYNITRIKNVVDECNLRDYYASVHNCWA